ncbi:MAG: amino acid dehydrogenase [Rhodocyclaceae bacterium]|jgi:D-amino-acid dehydrogenase|nr:amino acid dehydrogenase [Rhodocyclaceae bacterium]
MHVIVLGAGLTGVTTAWYLRQAGHEVTVIDRQPAAGLETSFANGGQISVSHPEPWANPGAPAQVLRWLGREDAPLLFRPRADWRQWAWGLRFLVECLPGRTRRNTGAIANLALYSHTRLQALREATGIEYDHLGSGILHVFFEAREFARAELRATLLRGFGMRAEVLDASGCVAIEPALAHCRDTLAGGLYAPEDESGDAWKFTNRLAALCVENGASFRYDARIEALDVRGNRVTAASILDAGTGRDRIEGDAFIVALGSHSSLLLRSLGEELPIYPVKGYSVTLPLAPDAKAPQVSITDESRRIVCSRLGNRLRVAGTAELTGYDTAINHKRCEAILRRMRELFPQIEAAGEIEYWAGLRPATPSNVPIIGRVRCENLYCNTGHGTLGWTLACGSAQAVADIVSGHRPGVEFPFHGLSRGDFLWS